MNAKKRPLLKLSKSERRYWPIITAISAAEWSDADNLVAAQMCRDLGMLEELARSDIGAKLMPDVCRRVHECAQLLKLSEAGAAKRTSTQAKIIATILRGV